MVLEIGLFLMVFKRLNGKSPLSRLMCKKDLHYFLFHIYYTSHRYGKQKHTKTAEIIATSFRCCLEHRSKEWFFISERMMFEN